MSEAGNILDHFFKGDMLSRFGVRKMFRKVERLYGPDAIDVIKADPAGALAAIMKVIEED